MLNKNLEYCQQLNKLFILEGIAMEIGNIPEMKEFNVEIKDENTTAKKKTLRYIILSAIVVMVISGIASYVYCTGVMSSGYNKIIEVEIGKDGTTVESLAKTFIPDLNVKKAVKLIMKENNYINENPILRHGQIVKIPTKEKENPVLVKPFKVKAKVTDYNQ